MRKGKETCVWLMGCDGRAADGEKVKGMRHRRSANYRLARPLSFLDNLQAVGEPGIAGDCGGRRRYIAVDFSRHLSSTSIKRSANGWRGPGSETSQQEAESWLAHILLLVCCVLCQEVRRGKEVSAALDAGSCSDWLLRILTSLVHRGQWNLS